MVLVRKAGRQGTTAMCMSQSFPASHDVGSWAGMGCRDQGYYNHYTTEGHISATPRFGAYVVSVGVLEGALAEGSFVNFTRVQCPHVSTQYEVGDDMCDTFAPTEDERMELDGAEGVVLSSSGRASLLFCQTRIACRGSTLACCMCAAIGSRSSLYRAWRPT